MAHRKPHLPEKTCPACRRTFAWRRKWARDWDSLLYCSAACRDGRYQAATRDAGKRVPDRARKGPRKGA